MAATARSTGFMQRCWELCATIPRGKVATYGELARALGSPHAARAVGQAMARNPDAPRVPCHRVVGADGRLTGFSADGGTAGKARMLQSEGVEVRDGRVPREFFHRFDRSVKT